MQAPPYTPRTDGALARFLAMHEQLHKQKPALPFEIATFQVRFGLRLRALRQVRGLSQNALAAHSSVTHETVCRLELGKHLVKLETLTKLAIALGTSVESLLIGIEAEQGQKGDTP